jgi:hypothetical protein
MDCCKNDLGQFPHNEDVDTGALADQVGVWKALLTFGAAKITRSFTIANLNDPIIVPRPFNELYQYSMQIMKPDNSLLEVTNCTIFAFKTYIAIAPCAEPICP